MARSGRIRAIGGLLAALALGCAFPAGAPAEQASQPASAAAGTLDIGRYHACAILELGSVRCWGFGGGGSLGYAGEDTIGDDETPAAAGPVDLGPGRTAVALSAGWFHTCALLDHGDVRCWGLGLDGRLGYGNALTIGDDEAPSAAGPVNLGPGRTARAIAAGGAHTCAILDTGAVRCWGFGIDGRLGYGDQNTIGDNEAPAAVGPVMLGTGRTAAAITAGNAHTCALLDDGTVRCWGNARFGQVGSGNTFTFSATQTPDTLPLVALGGAAVAISAGDFHTCALLAGGAVRCWGVGLNGRLGYGNTNTIGDDETPDAAGPVDLGRPAVAISAGADHTCAVLDDGTVRCWGAGHDGQLGYGNTADIGDDEQPSAAGPVDLGPGRTAVAIAAGSTSTCARLDDGSLRCWGDGANGLLGSCSTASVGDDETPGSAGPVDLGEPGRPGAGCAPARPAAPAPPRAGAPTPDDGLAAQQRRAAALRRCRSGVAARARAQRRGVPSRGRARAARLRVILRRERQADRACLKRYARTPGRVTAVRATVTGPGRIALSFRAPGTDGSKPPPARSYLVRQSLRPIRTARDFRRADALCKGACTFGDAQLGSTITLNVTDLRRGRTYYYAVAARDNVTALAGPRSKTVAARVR